jgi:hypothetical protein
LVGSSLVDEDPLCGVQRRLMLAPLGPCLRDIRPILLGSRCVF